MRTLRSGEPSVMEVTDGLDQVVIGRSRENCNTHTHTRAHGSLQINGLITKNKNEGIKLGFFHPVSVWCSPDINILSVLNPERAVPFSLIFNNILNCTYAGSFCRFGVLGARMWVCKNLEGKTDLSKQTWIITHILIRQRRTAQSHHWCSPSLPSRCCRCCHCHHRCRQPEDQQSERERKKRSVSPVQSELWGTEKTWNLKLKNKELFLNTQADFSPLTRGKQSHHFSLEVTSSTDCF